MFERFAQVNPESTLENFSLVGTLLVGIAAVARFCYWAMNRMVVSADAELDRLRRAERDHEAREELLNERLLEVTSEIAAVQAEMRMLEVALRERDERIRRLEDQGD